MTSSLYRELTPEELSTVITAALNTGIVSARLLTGGLFNTTYFVDTEGCGRVVLRVGPVNRHLLMPFEHHPMEAESQAYALCERQGVPVSQVLALDTKKQWIGRDVMIVRYIPSRPLSEASLEPEDRARIYYDIGRATALMHQITQRRFGRLPDVHAGRGFDRWSDFLLDEFDQWERVAAPTGIFTEEERQQMRQLWKRYAPLLDEVRTPCLVHTDLWEGNLLIRTDTAQPEFAAIIDADRALWGDAEFEFSSIRWMLNEDFLAGYGRAIPQQGENGTRQSLYCLLCGLWNAYVYEQEYNNHEQMVRTREEVREMLGILSS